jgi:hypothetical protein
MKLHLFGVWADPQNALACWLDEKDDLLARRVPRCRSRVGLRQSTRCKNGSSCGPRLPKAERIAGVAENERHGEVGLRFMNEMWQVVKSARILTTSTNHWVYLPGGRIFVGIELRNAQQIPAPDQLEPLEFEF